MKSFYEEWSVILEPSRPLIMDDFKDKNIHLPIRPLAMDELRQDDIIAFLRVGFTHHREVFDKS